MAFEKAAYIEAVVGADITNFRRGMREIRNEMGILSEEVSGIGHIGRNLTFALTTPLLVGAASAIKLSTDVDKNLKNINSIARLTDAELENLGDRLRTLSMNTRYNIREVTEAGYQVFSAGVLNVDHAFAITKYATDLAEAGISDLESTTKMLTAVMLNYRDMGVTEQFASDVIANMVAFGVGDMQDATRNMHKVTPVARALGISFEDVGAAIALVSQSTADMSKAQTSMSQIMVNLMRASKHTMGVFKKVGVSTFRELIDKSGGFFEAIIRLRKATTQEEFLKMFSKTGVEGAMALTNNIDQMLERRGEFMANLENATELMRTEQMKSDAYMFDMLGASIEGFADAVGRALMPIVRPFVKGLTEMFRFLAELPKQVLALVVTLTALGAALPPLMWLFGSVSSAAALAKNVAATATATKALATGAKVATAGLSNVAATTVGATAKVGLLTTAFSALSAGWAATKSKKALIDVSGIDNSLGKTLAVAVNKDITKHNKIAGFAMGFEFVAIGVSKLMFTLLKFVPILGLVGAGLALLKFDLSSFMDNVMGLIQGSALLTDVFTSLGLLPQQAMQTITDNAVSVPITEIVTVKKDDSWWAIWQDQFKTMIPEWSDFKSLLEANNIDIKKPIKIGDVYTLDVSSFKGDLVTAGQEMTLMAAAQVVELPFGIKLGKDALLELENIGNKITSFLSAINFDYTKIGEAFTGFGDTLAGAFDRLKSIDTTVIERIAQSLAVFGLILLSFVDDIVIAIANTGGSVLTMFVEAVATIIDVLSKLTKGDFGGALSTLANGIGRLTDELAKLSLEVARVPVAIIDDVFGTNLGTTLDQSKLIIDEMGLIDGMGAVLSEALGTNKGNPVEVPVTAVGLLTYEFEPPSIDPSMRKFLTEGFTPTPNEPLKSLTDDLSTVMTDIPVTHIPIVINPPETGELRNNVTAEMVALAESITAQAATMTPSQIVDNFVTPVATAFEGAFGSSGVVTTTWVTFSTMLINDFNILTNGLTNLLLTVTEFSTQAPILLNNAIGSITTAFQSMTNAVVTLAHALADIEMRLSRLGVSGGFTPQASQVSNVTINTAASANEVVHEMRRRGVNI